MTNPKRIVFLMSDSGGGHRAVAEAIRAGMKLKYPGQYRFELVDVYRRYTPFPFTYMPEIYAHWVNSANRVWGAGYKFFDGRRRAALLSTALNWYWRKTFPRLIHEHPADVMVSVHTMFTRPALNAFQSAGVRSRPPFVAVLTDLVSTHTLAYAQAADRCLVPTQQAFDRGLALGMRAEQMRVTGLPVHPRFVLPSREQARRNLGWNSTRPVVLVLSGGDGMGPVFQIASKLNARQLDIELAIVAGRNTMLRRQLDSVTWQQPTQVYGFVRNMPDLMAAADMLITKAGPSTISEACIAGLPMILSGKVLGQEDGNITHVVTHGAGISAPGAEQVADTVAAWLAAGPDDLAMRAQAARSLARPDAVWISAEEIHLQAQRGPIPTHSRVQRKLRLPRVQIAPEDGWLI